VPFAHSALAASMDLASYRTQIFRWCSLQTASATDAGGRLDGAASYAYVWPNLMLNRCARPAPLLAGQPFRLWSDLPAAWCLFCVVRRYGPWMDINLVHPGRLPHDCLT